MAYAVQQLGAGSGPFAGVRFDAVVSVPSASAVTREFAIALASAIGVPAVELRKTRATDPQKKFRSRERKKRNIEGAFEDPTGATYGDVLLVDDIIDSGESLAAARAALTASRVFPLVLALTKHRDEA